MKVVVCGPPHSGKSTFTATLISAVRDRLKNRRFNPAFTWIPLDVTDNTIAALLNDGSDVPRKRDDIKFTEERAEERRSVFAARDETVVLGDSPGLITEELRIITEPADAMILLVSRDKSDRIEEWREFARNQGIQLYAEFLTVIDDDYDPRWVNRARRQGIIRSVHRNDFSRQGVDTLDSTSRRILKQLAIDLLESADEFVEERGRPDDLDRAISEMDNSTDESDNWLDDETESNEDHTESDLEKQSSQENEESTEPDTTDESSDSADPSQSETNDDDDDDDST